MIPSQTARLYHEFLVKKNVLVELCARNYIKSNGIVNVANGTFQIIHKCSQNPQIGSNTRRKL
jgi:hypothetical protein